MQFLLSGLTAQDPVFVATTSGNKVVQNSVFSIQFELRNAEGDDFTPPSFGDFRVVGGPAVSSSTMIVNGQVSRSQSWTYSLLATQQGIFSIGPATIIAGRRKIGTRPVSVEVVAARDIATSPSNPSGDDPVFLVAEITNRDYYPGQQIRLNYKLIFKENVQTVNVMSEDDYADFFLQGFNPNNRDVEYETINGETYASRVIKSIALFAHQSGTYTIDPMVMEVGINAPYPVNQGFFTMRRLKNIQIASKTLDVKILPLPTPAPETFTGAVGNYTVNSIPGSKQLTTDDDFSLRLEITGDGDSKRWDPPSPPVNQDFELYNPRILEDHLQEADGKIIHTRSIEYLMIPQKAGEFAVSVPFTFFNPVTSTYKTIGGDTFQLQVAQGNAMVRRAIADTLHAEPLELRSVQNRTSDDRFWLSLSHLFLFGLLLSGTFFGLFVSYKRERDARIPASERIRSAAARHARQQLDEIAKADEITGKPFFEKATEIYSRFLTEKFSILPADLDVAFLQQTLQKANFSEITVARAVTFFEQCLSVRYGGIPGGFTKEKMIDEIRDIIDTLGS